MFGIKKAIFNIINGGLVGKDYKELVIAVVKNIIADRNRLQQCRWELQRVVLRHLTPTRTLCVLLSSVNLLYAAVSASGKYLNYCKLLHTMVCERRPT